MIPGLFMPPGFMRGQEPLGYTKIAYGSSAATGTSVTVNTNATIEPGNYIIIVAARENDGTTPRTLSAVSLAGSASEAATILRQQSNNNNGVCVLAVCGVVSALSQSGVNVSIILSAGVNGGIGVWIYRVRGIANPTTAYSADSNASGCSLSTPPNGGMAFAVVQGTSPVTYNSSHGAGSVDPDVRTHEANADSHVVVVQSVTPGMPSTAFGISTNRGAAGVVLAAA